MPGTWRTIRVFISSTFKDMQAERDHLVRFVFPRLREELLQRRIHLVDVDLRWGVTSDQDASEVCREIVDECRPRFLCMLGGRYGWVPPGKDRSITADEVHYGVLDRIGRHGYAFFYFRDPVATAAMVEEQAGQFREPPGSPHERNLAELKETIGRLGLGTFTYPAEWDEQHRRLVGLTEFGQRVHADLLASIDAEFGTQPAAKLGEFAEENAAMEAFAEERSQRFVLGSRETVWNELLRHAESTGGNGSLCLIGEPGSGKSALLAKFSQALQSSASALIIAHFVGASPSSTDGPRTLRRLCHELVQGAALTAEIPEDPEKLRAAFSEILKHACAKTRVVLLLDAVNQFDPGSSDLSWLPEALPENARIILSTLPGPALDDLTRRPIPPREVTLPPLAADDADAIIDEFLNRYRKSVTEEQRATLRVKTDAVTPLYLLAALEELRTLGTYEEITVRIRELPETTQALFVWILKRLEDDPGFRDADGRLVGPKLVGGFSTYFAASQHGLSQSELVDLLEPGDPQGNVAALLQLLRPYLMRRGELLDFYHGQFRSAAEQQYLRTDDQRKAAHDVLAGYFRRRADPGGDQHWHGESARPFLELPFHLTKAAALGGSDVLEWQRLASLLIDFAFLEAKLKHGLLNELCLDFGAALEDMPTCNGRGLIGRVATAIRLEQHFLRRHPEMLFPALYNHLQWSEGEMQQLLEKGRGRYLDDGQVFIHQYRRPIVQNCSLALVLSGHTDKVTSCNFSPDQLMIASSGRDGIVCVHDSQTGDKIRSIPVTSRYVNQCCFSPDGRWLLSASSDGTLQLWDCKTGKETATFKGHRHQVSACSFSPDGKMIASGGWDQLLMTWDSSAGKRKKVFKGHSDIVTSCCFSPNGNQLISASEDKTIRVWDSASGRVRAQLTGHADAVTCCAFSPDGRQIVSASYDGTLRVWCADTYQALATIKARNGPVSCCAYSPDGKQIISGSHDGTVWIWCAKTYAKIETLKRHTDAVTCCAFSPDGTKIISSSYDRTVLVWDRSLQYDISNMRAHAGGINASKYSPDGSLVASASDDGTVTVWRSESGTEVVVLRGNAGRVNACAFSPEGKKVALACEDKVLSIWEVNGGAPVLTLRGHSGAVSDCAFTHNGERIFSAGEDRRVKVWDARTGSALATLGDDTPTGITCTLSPDGRRVLVGDVNKITGAMGLSLWDGARLTRLHDFHVAVSDEGEKGGLAWWSDETGQMAESLKKKWPPFTSGYAFSPQGERVAHTGRMFSQALNVWDTNTGKRLKYLHDHSAEVDICSFSPDGSKIASGSCDCTLKLWNSQTGDVCFTLVGHADRVTASCFTADGRYLVSASDDKTLRLWSVETGKTLSVFSLEAPVYFLSSSPNRSSFVSGDTAGNLYFFRILGVTEGAPIVTPARIWLYETGQWDDGVTVVCKHCGERHVPVNSDSLEHLAGISPSTSTRDMTLAADSANAAAIPITCPRCRGELLCTLFWSNEFERLSEEGDRSGQRLKRVEECHGHRDRAVCVYSPDGAKLASGSWDKTIRIRNVATGTKEPRVVTLKERVNTCAFSPDGELLVSGGDDCMLTLWDGNNGKLVARFKKAFKGHLRAITTCCFSPDGRLICSGSLDETLKHWDTASGDEMCTFWGHTAVVSSCLYLPDGIGMVSAGHDKTLRLWSSGRDSPLLTLNSRCDGICACACSPDGCRLVSGSMDGSVEIWDVRKRSVEMVLKGHGNAVSACDYSFGGDLIATGDSDGILCVWLADSGERFAVYNLRKSVVSVRFSPNGGSLIATDAAGVCHMFELHEVEQATPFVTATYWWRVKAKHWEAAPSVVCRHCGCKVAVEQRIVDIIKNMWSRTHPAALSYLGLPQEAWKGNGLFVTCPECSGGLRYNPFLVDNRE